MRKVPLKSLELLLFAILLATIFSHGKMVCASESPIDIKLSVANSKVIVGQPILVDCLLTNPTETPGITIEATDTSGCQVWFDLYDASNHLIVKTIRPTREHHSIAMLYRVTRSEPHKIAYVVSRAALYREHLLRARGQEAHR